MSLNLASAADHLSYSFSSMACEVCRYFSPSRVSILDLENRGWLISISKSLACSLYLFPMCDKYE
jgi:hypothetical protein